MRKQPKRLLSLLLSFVMLLGVKFASNCNLSSEQELTLAFSGTASCVKAFMLESGGFAPRCIAVEDHDLSK